jgi:hypothetical protein
MNPGFQRRGGLLADTNGLQSPAPGVPAFRAALHSRSCAGGESIALLREPEMPSARAAESSTYERLGLADAAITTVAREHNCTVLTDDFDLYMALTREGLSAVNFNHLRERDWDRAILDR